MLTEEKQMNTFCLKQCIESWQEMKLDSVLHVSNGTDFSFFPKPSVSNGASLVAQRLKHLPAIGEIQVRSLGWEDPLEKEMAIHSSILAWRIPWTEEPGRLQSTGSQRVRHDSVTSLSLSVFQILLLEYLW